VSSVSLGGGSQSLGGLGKCSEMNQKSFGHPLKLTTSPVVHLGRPLKQASEVRAKATPQLPSKNPICWDPASWIKFQKYFLIYYINKQTTFVVILWRFNHYDLAIRLYNSFVFFERINRKISLTLLVIGTSMGTGTTPAMTHP
jgi:hypothetical protein